MRKWIEWGLGAVIVIVAMVGALYSILGPAADRKVETARTAFAKSRSELRTRISARDAGAVSSQAVCDPRDSAGDNVVALAGFVERLGSLVKEVPAPYSLCFPMSPRKEADWVAAKALVERFRPLLDDLREFARKAPKGSMQELTPDSFKDLLLLGDINYLVDLCGLSAQVSAHSGDMEAAVEDLATIFRLAVVSPPMDYVRRSSWGAGHRVFESAFAPGVLTREQCDRIIALAEESVADREMFAEGLINQTDLDSMWLANPAIECEVDPGRITWQQSLSYRAASTPFAQPFRANDIARMITTTEDVLALADRPYYEVRAQLDAIRQQTSGLVSLDPLSSRPPSAYWSFIDQVRAEAELDLLRLGLTIELYQAEHGSYPASLEVIVASVGGTIPVDPFTGQPYQYRVSGDTFTLYSLGDDQTDQGGVRWRGDVVWREEILQVSADKMRQAEGQ